VRRILRVDVEGGSYRTATATAKAFVLWIFLKLRRCVGKQLHRKKRELGKRKNTSTAIAKALGIWLKALPKFGALSKKAQ
jgi:hypothetical protein